MDDVWPNIPALLYVRLLKHIRKGSHKGKLNLRKSETHVADDAFILV